MPFCQVIICILGVIPEFDSNGKSAKKRFHKLQNTSRIICFPADDLSSRFLSLSYKNNAAAREMNFHNYFHNSSHGTAALIGVTF